MKMRRAFVLFLMMFLAFNAQAQEQEQEQKTELDFGKLTLENAINYALMHSPKIKQAQISQLLNVAESIATAKLALLGAQAEAKLTELKLKQEIGLQ